MSALSKWMLITAFLLQTLPSRASDVRIIESKACDTVFKKAGASGTFVMWDVARDVWTGHDAVRARQRFVPASTFKIPNSLIGLDCGAVENVDEIFPYDGSKRMLPSWEKAMGLREAIRVSNVPVYQELARRIGLERMRAGVQKLDYGNRDIGNVVDRFWLDGPLKISAVEQVKFLRRLAEGDVPFSPEAIRAVQEITLLETFPGGELHGKTGWATSTNPQVGWFVGWVKRDGKILPFALNMVVNDEADLPRRPALAKDCLRRLGALPE